MMYQSNFFKFRTFSSLCAATNLQYKQNGSKRWPTSRLEFGKQQPAIASQNYRLVCYPNSGWQETVGQPISQTKYVTKLVVGIGWEKHNR